MCHVDHFFVDLLIRNLAEECRGFRTSYGYSKVVSIVPWSRGFIATMCSRERNTTRPIATMPFALMASRNTANASSP
jgi:hypothetical protein